MSRLLFVLPKVGPGDEVVVTSDSSGTTPAEIISTGGGQPITGSKLHAAGDGSLPRVYGPNDGTSTLYVAKLTYRGTVTGTPAAVTGTDPNAQPSQPGTYVPVTRTVAGQPLSADVTLTKADVGLSNVNNTSDANKPISTAAQAALDLKAPLAAFGAYMFGVDPALTDGSLVPPWRPAAPMSSQLVTNAMLTGGAFPVTASSAAASVSTRLARISIPLNGSGQPISSTMRVLFTVTLPVTSANFGAAFLTLSPRQSNGNGIAGYSDVNVVGSYISPTGYTGMHELINIPSNANFVDVYYTAQNTYTGNISLAALTAWMLTAPGDLIRTGSVTSNIDTTTTAANLFATVDRPAYDKDGRLIRVRTGFANDSTQECAYGITSAFPESSYASSSSVAANLPGMAGNATGTFSLVDSGAALSGNAPLHINNNDLVMSIRKPDNSTYELRCNAHGGETGRNGNMSLDYIFEVDRGDGAWVRVKGNGWQYAGYRVRVTMHTKVTRTGDAGPFAYIDRVYTFFADGTTRVDRTVTFLADTVTDQLFIIMNSLDFAAQANVGRLGVGQQVLREFNARRPTNTVGGSGGSLNTVAPITVNTASTAGATTLVVTGANSVLAPGFVGSRISIGSGGTLEYARVASVSGQTLTLDAALANAHSVGETVFQVDDPTTLSSATAVGATSISTAGPVARNAYVLIDTGKRQERRRLTANPTGSGPYTATIDSGLLWAHASGAPVEVIYVGDDLQADGRNEWVAYQEPQYRASFGQIFDRVSLLAHLSGASLFSTLVRGAALSIAKAYTILKPTAPATVTNGTVWTDTFYWRYYIPRDNEQWHREISDLSAITTTQRAALYPTT